MTLTVLVLVGPNLNLLGTREPALYGRHTLEDVRRRLEEVGVELDAEVYFSQTNSEAEYLTRLHAAAETRGWSAVLVNPGAWSHTSLAILDALRAIPQEVPKVEVHVTNLHARLEREQRPLLTAGAVDGLVMGLGFLSWEAGLRAVVSIARARAREDALTTLRERDRA